jgi:Zn-dependent protease with chaperone function
MFQCAQCDKSLGADPFVCAACGHQRNRSTATEVVLSIVLGTAAIAGAAVMIGRFERGAALIFALPLLAIAAMTYAFLLPFPFSRYAYRSGQWSLALFALVLVASAVFSS